MWPIRRLQKQIILISAPLLTMAFSLMAIPLVYSAGIIGARPAQMPKLPSIELPGAVLINNEFGGRNMINLANVEKVQDPFEFKKVTEKTVEKLAEIELNMVVFSPGDAFCKVNGKLYRKGDSGPGFTILKIDETGVWFATGNRTFFLAPGQKSLIATNHQQHTESKRRVL